MKEISLPQGNLRYVDVGSGPPLVFVHGFMTDSRLWRDVIEHLSVSHRCIAPDWPLGAHELPMNADADVSPLGVARMVADLLAALDLDDVTLVGNDSGGAICQLVAAHHGERIGRLILTNCDALDVFPPPAFEYLRTVVRVPGLLWLMSQALFYSRRLRHLSIAFGRVSKRGLPDDLVRSWVAPGTRSRAVRRDIKKLATELQPRYTLEAAEILAGRDLPVLMAWSSEDRFFPIELARRLQDKLRDARIEPISDSWAFVPVDQPARLAGLITRFARPAPAQASMAS